MTCELCAIPVGTVVPGEAGGRTTCGVQMPRGVVLCIHRGKNENGMHVFLPLIPRICPACGNPVTFQLPCEDEGILVEFPIVIELPVLEEM